MQVALVRSTYAREEDAWQAAEDLVRRRLAACVHVQSIRSCYRWEGDVQDDAEWLLEARCLEGRRDEAVAAVSEGHPYDVPMVETLTASVAGPYAAWMREGAG